MQNQATSHVSLAQFSAVAGKIGLLSFGGPAAQIALMQDELVDKRGWISQQDFLRALSFCMLLPGPEAMQLATYLGWRLHGLRGGFIGGTLFILPGACVIFALAWAYVQFGHTSWSQAAFTGIKACVIVIVLQALLKICARALILPMAWAIAASSFCASRTVRSALSLGDFGSSAMGYCWAARIGPSKHPHPCTQAKHSARLQRPCGPLGAAHCHPLEHETDIPNQNRPAFFNPGRGDLRWGLCGFGVSGANGRNRSELAVSATDDRCLGACGNHAGATDFGDAIRGISRRVSGRRALFGLYRRPPDALGDVPSLFFVDFSLCPAS